MTTSAPPSTKKRIVILGGGAAGLTTALNLTDPANPRRDEFDITIYQLGWRFGGKGASGRNMDPALNYRIEEHGLHVWFGCYDNAFRLIQKCYTELGRAPDAPMASWTDAFKPHSAGGTLDFTNGKVRPWLEQFPPNDAVPGEGDLSPLRDYALEAYKLLHTLLDKSPHTRPSPTGDDNVDTTDWQEREKSEGRESSVEDVVFRAVNWVVQKVAPISFLLHFAEGLALWVSGLLLRWRWLRIKDRINTPAGLGDRHFWVLANAIYAALNGFHKGRVFARGLRSQNGIDFRDWLGKYCVDDDDYLKNSDWIRGVYDGIFAFVDGDNRTPKGAPFPPKASIEAGVALLCGVRQFGTYKGAAVWRMQAGMGDTIFAPIYEVLERRGVKFKLFHKVEALRTADGKTVTSVEIARQATVKPERERYDPLIDVKGLPCWPSTPLYDQLVEGEEIRARGVNLEDYDPPDWKPVECIELVAGRDYDELVLAISIGALPYICPDLIRANDKWRDMVHHVLTNRTLSAQFWFSRSASELGWSLMQRPLISGYDITSLDTWADMSYLLAQENWHMAPPARANRPPTATETDDDGDRAGQYPLQVSYFCGPMPDDPPLKMTPVGPIADPAGLDQRRANAAAREVARKLLTDQIAPFFPKALRRKDTPRLAAIGGTQGTEFCWELLVDTKADAEGPARLDSQYWKANVQPSERYVLSVPGSDKFRIAPGESGFARLTLAGDWTDCGMNAGCVEGAVMSGMLASNALSAFPKRTDVVGLDWW